MALLRGGRLKILEFAKRGGVCAEVGVWKGGFSQRILLSCQPKELHLIDPWLFCPEFPRRAYGGRVAKSQQDMDMMAESVIKFFRRYPAVKVHRDRSTDIAARFPPRTFDWVYIDGDHSYQAVLDDLTAWYPKIKSGGYLCGDDLRWPDESGQLSVQAAVRTFLAGVKTMSAAVLSDQFVIRAE